MLFIEKNIPRRTMAKKSRTTDTRPGKKNRSSLMGLFIVIVILVLAGTTYYFSTVNDDREAQTWSLDESNTPSFGHRTLPDVKVTLVEDTANYTLQKISYPSYGTMIFGLLRIPKEIEKPPVVIVLPAATITKEADAPMADALRSFGYASLTFDERGNGGETLGISPMDLTAGYAAFRSGEIPAQYAQIYDVLLAYDYIRSREDLDGSSIAILGESMGGRFAIIAAGIEPGIKGAFVISSGPYGVDAVANPEVQRFVTSIEPATYLSKLPPRTLVMFHFTSDPIIPIAEGKVLYDMAPLPKAWHQYNGTVHGVYSDVYAGDLQNELKAIFGR